jgi:hypothetical protein
MFPVPMNGQIASAPQRSMIARNRPAISPRASSHEMRSKRPLPLGPQRRIGWSSRSGERVYAR